MTTLVRSIDAAAAGYIRHRFVRALCASFVVAIVFLLAAIFVLVMAQAAAQGDWAQVAVAPILALLMVILMLAPIALCIGLVGALIDLTHRRLIALALLAASLAGFFFLLAGSLAVVAIFAGVLPPGERSTPASPTEDFWFGVTAVVGALIAYQLARQSWWQLTVSAPDFRAARGWRPPPWRLLTSFRRHLGLPSFLSYVGKKRRIVTLLYFSVAVLNLGLLMLLSLPLALGSEANVAREQQSVIEYVVMAALLLLNLFGAGALLSRVADRRATKLYQNVREWDTRPPVVFLRDFDQDKQSLRARGGDPFARWPAGVGRPRTLDEILLEHGSPYGPVIAIGDPRDPTPPLGAARVFVEGAGNEWQDVVRALAGASRAVVMCPNHGEGVQWELDLIAQAGGRLHTIFLASPELDRQATLALFERLVPSVPEIPFKQWPVAAYAKDGAWRVLTAKRLSVESYTAALNTALQALFGLKGVAVPKRSAAQQHGAAVDRLRVAGA